MLEYENITIDLYFMNSFNWQKFFHKECTDIFESHLGQKIRELHICHWYSSMNRI